MRAVALALLLLASPLKSGLEFVSPEIRKLQADDFANPGMLWVARGEKLFHTPGGKRQKPCADCHGKNAVDLKGVAARYPKLDRSTGRLVNIAGRVNICRDRRQVAEELPAESEDLLALTAYVTHQSRGMPIVFTPSPELAPHLERGRELYHRRIGQMNLACTHCHDSNWGKRLLNETISQGHPNAFPAYRLSWESLGSLSRRIRACFYGIRAEMPEYGAPELVELELYLASRAHGLPIESPGVRR